MTAIIRVGQPRHLSSDDAYSECRAHVGLSEISDSCAVTIASWWQAPFGTGYAMAQLASIGTVDYDELAEDIYRSRLEADTPQDRLALDMLATWALSKVR